MIGEQSSILRRVPLSAGSPEIQASKSVAIGASASAAQPVPGTSANPQNSTLVFLTLAPTVNARIAFGTSSVSAGATDRLIFGGSETDYCITPGITHFSVIKDAAATTGELSWHVSS